MKPLRVIALFDGRPGHEKQTSGIVKALKKRTDVQLTEITIQKLSLFKTVCLTLQFFLTMYGKKNPLAEQGDLLIGTGSGVHLFLLLYKRKYSIPAVTCMAPASYLRPFFDICFVPEHDNHKKFSNVFFTIGAPNCSEDKKLHQENAGLILIGGVDEKSHHWESKTISMMVKNIVEKEKNIYWTISSSPRTPKETVSDMEKFAMDYTNCSFFDYIETPKGWIEKQYDQSSVVWVTSDSISMLFEALTAGCKIGLLAVGWKNPNNKFKYNEEVLLRKKLVTSYDEWERGNITWSNPCGLKEAQRCADRILQTWWPENLQ